ncbi:hypothetical protein V5O48_016772 [Marasmius crinis-equi]|uniref:Uncharacterized protein n=1 Tax=Marasmius crinis-equi TaxID=585013 RepID=A0ABR3EQX1_9AGAR
MKPGPKVDFQVVETENVRDFFVVEGSVFSRATWGDSGQLPLPPIPTVPEGRDSLDPNRVNDVFAVRRTTWFDPNRPYLALLPRFDMLRSDTHPAFRCLCYAPGRYPLVEIAPNRYKLDPAVIAKWDVLEQWIKRIVSLLIKIGGVGPPVMSKHFAFWPYPASYGYQRIVGTWSNVQRMAASARDSFLPLIAACSLFILHCQHRAKQDPLFDWKARLTPNQNYADLSKHKGAEIEFGDRYSTENHAAWIYEILHSFAADWRVERIGAIFDAKDSTTEYFNLMFKDLNMPIIFHWGSLSTLSLTGVHKTGINEHFHLLGPTSSDIEALLRKQSTGSPTPSTILPSDPNPPSATLPSDSNPPPTTLPSDSEIDRDCLIKRIPVQTDSGQQPGELVKDFLERRRLDDEQKALRASSGDLESWVNREREAKKFQCPGRRGPQVWYWEKNYFGDGPTDFFRVRTQLQRADARGIWTLYRNPKKVYNARANCWDICSELGDDPAPIDDRTWDEDDVDWEVDVSMPEEPDPIPTYSQLHGDYMEGVVEEGRPSQSPRPIGVTGLGSQRDSGNMQYPEDTGETDSASKAAVEGDGDTITEGPREIEPQLEEGELEEREVKEDASSSKSLAIKSLTLADQVSAQLLMPSEDMEENEIRFPDTIYDIAYSRYSYAGYSLASGTNPERVTWKFSAEALGNGRWFNTAGCDQLLEETPESSEIRERLQDFFTRLAKGTTEINATFDLFYPDSQISLRGYRRFGVIRRQVGEETMYQLNGIASQEDFHLLIPDPVTVLQIFRMYWGPTLVDVARQLIRTGVRFHPVVPGPPCPRGQPQTQRLKGEPRLGYRPKEYRPDRNDYWAYESARNQFLRGPRGKVALLEGGLVSRFARAVVDEEIAVYGPDSPTVVSSGHCFFEVDGTGYWGDILTDEEIDFICGVYYCATDRTQNWGDPAFLSTHRSWYPRPGAFKSSNLNIGFWSKDCERWYQHRVHECRHKQTDVKSAKKWKDGMKWNHKVQKMTKTARSIAYEFLKEKYP